MTRRRPAVVLYGTVLLAAASWTLWDHAASTRLEREIAVIAAAGLPTSATQVHPPELPPEESAQGRVGGSRSLLPQERQDEL